MVGNEQTVEVLQKFASDQDRPHSYLYSGPPGTGKTTCARVFAREIGTFSVAVREMNMSETRGIDTIREIIEVSKFPPIGGPSLVWILDEAHGITAEGVNSLLKILEDTPDYVYFILCTTEPSKINKAIQSRCVSVTFGPVSSRVIRSLISSVAAEEHIDIEPDVLKLLAKVSEGVPRRALVLLESLGKIDEIDGQLAFLKGGSYAVDEENEEVIDLLRSLTHGGASNWKHISALLHSFQTQSIDPERIRRAALGYLSKVLMNQTGTSAISTSKKMFELQEPTYNTGFPGLVNQIFRSLHMK
jgi:DNA polymerase III gamma/tau subunit